MSFTTEQVLKMAPDDASAKAGQQLAVESKWVLKAVGGNVVWGECQGSGKSPYKTMMDIANIAFKCSCPSRKFPCKHSLGLLLLYTRQPDCFTTNAEMPTDVAEWLQKRQVKAENKGEKKEEVVDEAARQKRIEAREKKINAGIGELRYWLQDVVRAGIVNVPKDGYNFNRNITARMVDAQAGGLAAQLRMINKINFYKEGWQLGLLKRLSKIYLLTDAYTRKDNLPASLKDDVLSLIGWTTPKEELMQKEAVQDSWTVLSIIVTDEDKLRTEHIWLYGQQTNRFALLLNFYGGNQTPEHHLVFSSVINAELVYFPGSFPLRAIIKSQQSTVINKAIGLSANKNTQSVYDGITDVLSKNPFVEQLPFFVGDALICYNESEWFLKDNDNKALPLANIEEECWSMLAFSKGNPVSVFGVYESDSFELHSLWQNDKSYFIK